MLTNKLAKQILIYGDSYVFGKVPGGQRYNAEKRYTGIVKKILGNEYEIIEEGLRGRMLIGENNFFPFRNGLEQFGPILGSHLPLDLVVIALGTNDTNSGEQQPEQTILGLNQYLDKLKWWSQHLGFSEPKVLLIVPPMVDEKAAAKVFGEIFQAAGAKMAILQKLMIKFCKGKKVSFLDLSKSIKVSSVDGVHLDQAGNDSVGQILAKKIKTLI